ncbi:hypothetical protein NE683_15195 [Bariatricus massiliensis]|uniref:Uncharacterized protein n=1 Tax=Bariatricus massiliensis TaxID=1745713 RepID=A0ABS8DHG2_9FIRM|nr:hypothetical protein [Bariatricus massiliensis]MCB7304848.1 hypothetical protein [Bariatricus massiliensis]MCB7375402.1 hypothetical protein [Bariatricus massiliensis]MCB7387862.1 hypothetical protein [Bariatricus massiliensis]MCB7412049.1 hypothetical protein [Bariatricus massiliensis]MCQ5254571.1 hypothetical protein [Bariatricus massiliensis]
MSRLNGLRPMSGMQMPDVEKIKCRTCKFAEKEHIGRAWCEKYPQGTYKPYEVCFDNTDCPDYEEGEDLLPYEIEI